MLWLSVVSVFKISSQLKSSKNYLTLLYYFSATSGQAEFKTCFNRIGVAQFSVFSALSTIVCLIVLFCPGYCRSKFGLICDGNYSEKSTFPHLFLTKEKYYYIWAFWVLCRLSHISGSTYRIKTKDLMLIPNFRYLLIMLLSCRTHCHKLSPSRL